MMRMKTVTLLLSCAMLAGCLPERRIVWSPDGSRAAIIASDGLRLCTPGGALTDPLPIAAQRVAWMPDSRRVVCVHTTKAREWKEIEPLHSPEQRQRIIAASDQLRAQLLDFRGDWEKFEPDLHPKATGGMLVAGMLFLRDVKPQGLAEHMGEKWSDLAKIEAEVAHLQVFSVAQGRPQPGPVVFKSLDSIECPVASPDNRFVSFVTFNGHPDGPSKDLVVSPADGSAPPLLAARNVAPAHDWSPDGRSLAYLYAPLPARESDDTVVLGAVATMAVADENGRLLAEPALQQDRAGILFNPAARVVWLADGRLVFSAAEVTLPASARDMPRAWTLFAIDPRAGSTVARILPRDLLDAVDPGLPVFEFRQDGREVLLPGPSGRVRRFDLVTGETIVLNDAVDPKKEWRSIPVWRGEEACYVVPPGSPLGSPHRSEIVLSRDGKTGRCLSREWPDAAVREWLLLAPETRPADR